MNRHNANIGVLIIFCLIITLCGCLSLNRHSNDPFHESFYDKARLIMMDEEKDFYHALPDNESRENFIEEFWEIRDPYPSTEENENKIEFEDRIAFANEWFGNWKTFAGRSKGKGKEIDRGWKTARGRIYIILGPPDLVNYDMGWGPMRTYTSYNSPYESWYYQRYDLIVNFYRNIPATQNVSLPIESPLGRPDVTFWDYELSPNSQLLYAIEDAKMEMIHPDYRDKFIKGADLEREYKNDFFYLKIPVDRVLYEEKEGDLCSRLHIKIDIHRNNEKIDELEVEKEIRFSEDEALEISEIEVSIPYVITDRGNYVFYLAVTDLNSMNKTEFRAVIKKDFN